MNTKYAMCFYALVLLTPFAAHASSSEHDSFEHARAEQEQHHSRLWEIFHFWESYLQSSHVNTGANFPTASTPTASVPEPGSLALIGAGIIGLIFARRQQN